MSDEPLLRSPLHDKHVALEASMADVAGWEMPLSYRGALDEVAMVRARAGVFDFSHTGRIRVRGDGALDLLERIFTHDVARQEDNTAVATLACNARGGIIDSGFLLRMEDSWLVLTSATARVKMLEHMQATAEGLDVKIDDQTPKTAMLFITGPAAAALLDKVLPEPVAAMTFGTAKTGSFMLAKYVVACVNLTGLWGLAVVIPGLFAGPAWRFITDKAGDNAIAPAGLAAMDVLRIEAGLGVYGHEINETIDPYTAGMADAVSMNHDFVGKEALAKLAAGTPARVRVGLVLEPKISMMAPAESASSAAPPAKLLSELVGQPPPVWIPRLGDPVFREDGSEAGAITSGTYSPMLGKVIALAYVARDLAEAGAPALVGAERQVGHVAELPFFKG